MYVDDIILTGTIGEFITRFKLAFDSRFDVQDLGLVAWLLGTTVVRDRRARTITLGQRQCILDILESFNMGSATMLALLWLRDTLTLTVPLSFKLTCLATA
jgi:hypothetical protein